ncbi:MAG TPA: energy transducer TonB [Thermoanaerobaculia bacterium]
MEERLELIIAERKKTGGLSLSVIVSFLLHGALLWWFVHAYKPMPPAAQNVPIARYVELIKQNPQQQFVEAPGQKLEKRPSYNAPLSDANRRAATPVDTGLTPTRRPGDGGGTFNPPPGQENARPGAQQPPMQAAPRQRPSQAQAASAASPFPPQPSTPGDDAFAYRESRAATQATQASAMNSIDWKSAIREAGRSGNLGRPDGADGLIGGEKGSAEQGPLSFETQWYDWGDYAQSMVSRIRVNWYANMPPLFKSGIGGVVTIRFTIHRDGRISDVTILQTSGHPPYDLAAKKAIEQSSPLKPLPADFPNPTERVTAMFYYNMEIPNRS